MAAKKVYDTKFKAKAVKMHREGVGVKDICARLNIHPPRLYEWIKKAVDIEDQHEQDLLAKFGDDPNLSVEEAMARDEASTPANVARLLVEMELLQEEMSDLRKKYVELKVNRGAA